MYYDVIDFLYYISDFKQYNDLCIITIVGNGFLRYMIRRLVGGALYASQKKDISYLQNIFKEQNSSNHLAVMPSKRFWNTLPCSFINSTSIHAGLAILTWKPG